MSHSWNPLKDNNKINQPSDFEDTNAGFGLGKLVEPVKYDNTPLVGFLKEYEGFEDAGYYATKSEEKEGIVTVGHGSTGRVKFGEKVEPEQAEAWFREDLEEAEGHIDDLVKVKLNDNQRMALVSLVQNIGRSRLLNSKALKNLNEGDFEGFMFEAYDPVMGFVKDKKGGEILGGLLKRRAGERKMFMGGLNSAEQKESTGAFDTKSDRFDELYLGY
jgi:GH24 family phage-related lysozyme (muramidase)